MEGRYYRKSPGRFRLRKYIRNKWFLLGVLVGFPMILYVFFGNHGLLQRFRLEEEKMELERRIVAIEEENRQLGLDAKALETDLSRIEKIARERYGMAREGETVYRMTRKTGDAMPPADKADSPARNEGAE